jgi:hypothetical protein
MSPLSKNLLFILLSIGLLSCNTGEDTSSKVTWIGGEIVNPKLDYVILSKDFKILDTVPLNDQNFFIYKSDSLAKGLYTFNHYEYQMFYLEPGDSLMFRVNTVDFDESLAFSGKGAERNNLLMEFFLMNEQEAKLIPGYYHLSPEMFQEKLDSMNSIRRTKFNAFIAENPSEKYFKAVANANINYDSYLKKEQYVSANVGNHSKVNLENYPKDFFDYRKEVDYGSKELRSYYPYYRFLNRLFDNLSHDLSTEGQEFDRNSFTHNYNKIKIIDSLVTDDSLKNRLARANVYNYLLHGNEMEKGKEIVALFSKVSTNKKFNKDISELSEATLRMATGKKIPNVFLLSTDNTIKDLHSTIKKQTVLFFWSSQSIKHFRSIHTKAAELNSKYPEYEFIGINTDSHFKKWRSIVFKSSYNPTNEFQFNNIKEAEKKLLINSANKAIILDKHGIILKGNTSLFDQNIETILLGYLNK